MRRVLVIDDEADVRLLYRVNLRHAGFEVLEADDGDRGIEAALAQPPDAVVLDLMMPRTDGFEVLRALRSDPVARDIPVIVLTADVRTDDHRRCYELGADDVITKPFAPEALIQGISRVLGATYEDRVARRRDAVAAGDTPFR
ncbi:MAG TPA: response regulator [Actinomycetota bacterium]|jgi:CheY-like chemotaxis protein|nr:response regulator [Actinomycetota bacterium]